MIRLKNWFTYLLFLINISFFSQICLADNIKEQMYDDLDFIGSIYSTAYTPESWKKDLFDWDLNEEISNAKTRVEALDNNLIREYQNILKDFFFSMRDYHVGFNFCSTEESFLPFMVIGANGKYFIADVLQTDNSMPGLPFNVGDEILNFGDKTTKEAVNELVSQLWRCNSATDTALAAMFLTMRSRTMAVNVPNGSITIRIKHKNNNEIKDYPLEWMYTPEMIHNQEMIYNPKVVHSDIYKTRSVTPIVSLGLGTGLLNSQSWINRNFSIPIWDQIRINKKYENPHSLGSRKSYIPKLGQIVWQTNSNAHFHAYVYLNENYQRIGYIRIPHYGGSTREVKEFVWLMRFFEWFTDGLVIDQINNPGGSLFYICALASVLSETPLKTPVMQEKIYQDFVYSAIKDLKILSTVRNDEEARELLGNDIDGYPVTYEFVKSVIEYDLFIINQWNSGNRITEKFPILGVREILPYQSFQYSKPILLIVNSLSFSGGDFFPAILQDNNRVTILGTTTAGAGGYVRQQVYPNIFGLSVFTFTGSIAYRLNDKPIENFGVSPDIIYNISEKDLQYNYINYKNMINEAVNDILE
jgi:hypothetical protein